MARTKRIISTAGVAYDSGGGKIGLDAAMSTGNALSGIGNTVSGLANQRIIIAKKKQAESDKLEASKLASEFAIETSQNFEELTRTQEKADGFNKVAIDAYEKLSEKYSSLGSNENVRKLIKLNAVNNKASYATSALAYEQKASMQERENNLDATVSNMASLVLKNPNNYAMAMEQSLGAVDSITNIYSNLEREAKKKDIASELSVAYISSLIGDGRISQAMSEINNNKLVIESLSTKQKIVLEKQATVKLKTIRSENSAATSSLMVDNIASIADTGVAIKGADPYSLYSKGMLTHRQMDKYDDSISQAERMYEFGQDLASTTLEDSFRQLSLEKPKGGESGYANKIKEWEAKQKVATQFVKNLSKDMVGTVLPSIDGLTGDDMDTPDGRAKVSMKLAQVGVPSSGRVYFSKPEIDGAIQEFNSNSFSVKNWIDENINNGYDIPIYTKDGDGDLVQSGTKNSGIAMIEAMSLSDNEPQGVRSILLAQDNVVAVQDIMNATKNYNDNKKIVDSKELKSIKADVSDRLRDFVENNIALNPNSSNAMASIQDDVYKLAVQYTVQGADNAIKLATKSVVEDTMQKAVIGGGGIYIPKIYKGREIEASFLEGYAEQYIRSEVDYNDLLLSMPIEDMDSNELTEQQKEFAKSNFENYAIFAPDGSGDALVLMAELSTGDRVVVKKKDGTPHKITYDSILSSQETFSPRTDFTVGGDMDRTLVIGDKYDTISY